MTGKVCTHHHDHHYWWHSLYARILAFLLLLIILVLLAILITWLVLRPTKPTFYLQDASVYAFNTSGDGPPNLLNTNIQVTIATRNPNGRVGIYYDRLDVFAAYKYQPITPATAIPRFYQGHKDIVLWSPFLCGVNVPIAPYLAASLEQDLYAGLLLLYVKIDGRVRWKVGGWTSGRYHLFVNCPAVLVFRRDGGGSADGGYSPVIRFNRLSACSVDV